MISLNPLKWGKRESVSKAGAQNMFGSLGAGKLSFSTTADFIPSDSEGGVISIAEGDRVNPVWLGLSTPRMQYFAYKFCSPLATVIDRLAEADTNGRIEFINQDGTTKTNFSGNSRLLRIMNLLRKPNPWQTWDEFNSQQKVFATTFGCCPVFGVGPVGFDKSYTKAMFNLPLTSATPVINEDFDLMDESKGSYIKYWNVRIGRKEYKIPSSDIFVIKDGYMDAFENNTNGLPLSKVAGLDFNVSNIIAAMEAENVLLKKKGPLGVFSVDPGKDMAGSTPINPKHAEELQSDLQRYGLTLGQLQYIISKVPVKWNGISFNLRDLMTKETIRTGIDGICDRLSYPAELMSGKNATYENRASAEKYLYQSNIIPFSLRKMAVYNEWFELYTDKLVMDFDHLLILQDDAIHAGQAYEAKVKGLDIAWKSGNITWNEWRKLQDMDTIDGMDIFYPEWLEKHGKSLNDQNNGKDTSSKDTGAQK